MLFRFAVGIALAGLLSGCATARRPTAVNNLQIQMSRVEGRLEENEQEVSELKYAVDELATSVAKLTHASASANRASQAEPVSFSEPAAPVKEEGAIRVPVTPEDVQTALKNAGYYAGSIDGKLGSGSQKAIRDFQKDNGLQSDGIVGRKTWAELKNFLQ